MHAFLSRLKAFHLLIISTKETINVTSHHDHVFNVETFLTIMSNITVSLLNKLSQRVHFQFNRFLCSPFKGILNLSAYRIL